MVNKTVKHYYNVQMDPENHEKNAFTCMQFNQNGTIEPSNSSFQYQGNDQGFCEHDDTLDHSLVNDLENIFKNAKFVFTPVK